MGVFLLSHPRWYECIKMGYKWQKWQFFAEIFVLFKNLSYLCTEFIRLYVMKELELEFVGIGAVRGFLFKQLGNNGKMYLYSAASPAGVVHYEVFERKENSRFGVVSYPGSPSFGAWAKCCSSYDRAARYFRDGFE